MGCRARRVLKRLKVHAAADYVKRESEPNLRLSALKPRYGWSSRDGAGQSIRFLARARLTSGCIRPRSRRWVGSRRGCKGQGLGFAGAAASVFEVDEHLFQFHDPLVLRQVAVAGAGDGLLVVVADEEQPLGCLEIGGSVTGGDRGRSGRSCPDDEEPESKPGEGRPDDPFAEYYNPVHGWFGIVAAVPHGRAIPRPW